MGGRWDAAVGGSDAPGSAEDGVVSSGRSLALCSELVRGPPPAAGCSRAWGSSEGVALFGTSFVSDPGDFSKTDTLSDTSLLWVADGLPGAGRCSATPVLPGAGFPGPGVPGVPSLVSSAAFSGGGDWEAAGFAETSLSPPPGCPAAGLSSSRAQGPRRSWLSLRRGGASASLLGMRGCCCPRTGPGPSPPPPASGCPQAGVCASSTARRLCVRSCRVLTTDWTPSWPSPGAGGGGSGPSASSTLGSLSRKTGQRVGDRIRGCRGAATRCARLQGGARKQSPAPPHFKKGHFRLLCTSGFQGVI